MHNRSWQRRWTRWATLVALVLATLAPTLSHALAAVAGRIAPWSVVCSTSPVGTVSAAARIARDGADGGAPVMPGDVAQVFEHCPACGLHATLAGPPAPVSAALPAPGLRHALPALFLHAPRPLFAWASAQPRAPPTLA